MYQKGKNSTVHSFDTPHGFHVPHKFPTKTAEDEDLMKLTGQLYPTGRAWYLPELGVFNKFHEALNVSLLRLIEDAFSMVDSSFPDNENFTEEDAELWEFKLGLVTNTNLTLDQRKVIILKKMSYPQNVNLRQSRAFIQQYLNDLGFNVGIYENIFYDEINNVYFRKLPNEIQSSSLLESQHGGNFQHSNSSQHGSGNFDVIANSSNDEEYAFGGNENLYATFFIASPTDISQRASIPLTRKTEFRETVLKLKPAHLIAFTFINYE